MHRSFSGFFLAFVFTFSLPLYAEDVSAWTLERVEEYAFQHNRELLALERFVEQGHYRKRGAEGRWLPSAQVSGEAVRMPVGQGDAGYSEFYSSILGFDQTLFSPDVFYGVKLSAADYNVLKRELELFRHDLLFRLRQAYYNIVLTRENAGVRRENSEKLAKALADEKRRFAVGEATAFDVNRSKVAVANSLSAYYEAVRDYKLAVNELINLLGMSPDCAPSLQVAATEVPVMSVPLLKSNISKVLGADREFLDLYVEGEDQLSEQDPFISDCERCHWELLAMRYRPDIQLREKLLDLAKEVVASRRGEYIPTFGAFANYHNDSGRSSVFSQPKSYWRFGVNVSWKLFDGFSRENGIKEAKSARQQALIEYQKSIVDAKLALSSRFYEMEQAFLSYFAAYEGVSLAEQAVEEASQRRDVGVITPLELRDTLNALAEAKYSFNRASYQLLIAYYGLEREAGVTGER